jgi:antitoxin VapB
MGSTMAGTAKIFMNGRSQAVRLPKDCRFDCDEVYAEKQGDRVILWAKTPTWDDFFDLESAFGDDFLADRDDVPPQERNTS